MQSWTNHADTSDLVVIKLTVDGGPGGMQMGTVSGTETDMRCGADCSALAVRGSTVTLGLVGVNNPTAPTTFAGWQGIPGCGPELTCTFVADRTTTGVATWG